jgi:PPIC-type PPIASE domain
VKRQLEQTKDQSFSNERQYRRFLRQSGQSQADINFRVREDVLANKIRQEVTKDSTSISDDDIEQYYDQNEQQFSQPERRDLQKIQTKDKAKAEEALRRLNSGESFKKVAKDLSTDPTTKQQGGRLLGLAKGQQEPELDKAIFSAEQDKLVGPIKTQSGFHVFKVSKVTPASKQSLEQSKESIRQLLISQNQQQSLDEFTTGFQQKWRERTDCRKGYVIPDCSNGELPPQQQGALGAGSGPPAKRGGGNPPALGGSQGGPAVPGGVPGGAVPGAALPGAAATGPPALSGTGGSPPALGGAGGGGGALPPGVVPQQGAPQQGAPPQGAPPPQQGAPPAQQGAPPAQQGAPPQGSQQP